MTYSNLNRRRCFKEIAVEDNAKKRGRLLLSVFGAAHRHNLARHREGYNSVDEFKMVWIDVRGSWDLESIVCVYEFKVIE